MLTRFLNFLESRVESQKFYGITISSLKSGIRGQGSGEISI